MNDLNGFNGAAVSISAVVRWLTKKGRPIRHSPFNVAIATPVIGINYSPLPPRLRPEPPELSPDSEEDPEEPPLEVLPPGRGEVDVDTPNAFAVCASTVPVAGSPFAC